MAVNDTRQWLLDEWHETRDMFIGAFDGPGDWVQWAVVAFCLILAWPVSLLVGKTIMCPEKGFRKACERFFGLSKSFSGYPLYASVLGWLMWTVAYLAQLPAGILYKFAFILTAYTIYSFSRQLAKGSFVPRMVSFLVFISVILELLGKRIDFINLLKSEIAFGGISFSPYAILSGIVTLTVVLWISSLLASAATRGLQKKKDLAPSTRVLLSKVFHVIGYVVSVLFALQTAGMNLTHLAVFSGALGIGLGFGLQKVISNFVSGIILLMDKSIKPGDVIEIDETFGWINSIRSRYVSVITRDRKEHLIPNEDLITNRVINWSFSDTFIRIKADIGVSYGSDPHQVKDICLDAIKSIPRILEFPEPVCLLTGFGDSSVDMQLRFWINDPKEGVGNIKSMVLFAVWDALKENNIEIPFPQRDLHLKSITVDSAKVLREEFEALKAQPEANSEE